MKIEYRDPAGAGAYATLADEDPANPTGLYDRITGYQPKNSSSPNVAQMFLSGSANVRDLGNGQWTLSFGVHRTHASAAAALAFIVTHAAIFDATAALAAGSLGNMDLKVTVGAQVVYMPACALTGFEPDGHSDQSTFCRYTLVGGTYTTVAP